jgi:plasmid replication initiation protein
MRELLYRPEIYGRIDIQIMTEFRSSYGLALYENCIRFQNVPSTPWLPIAVFKKLMGIAEDRYPSFCDLKKRVLDIAVKEVNLYSPIKMTPEIQRVNKKVISIKFKLFPKKELGNIEDQVADINSDLLELLRCEFLLSEKVTLEVLAN